MTKEYLEIEVVISEEIADQVSNFLIESGSEGVWTKPVGENWAIIGYWSNDLDTTRIKSSISLYLDELRKLGLDVGEGIVNLKEIKDKDWVEGWKKSFEPIFVADDIVILPDWDQTTYPNKIVIRIKPGMAFGTGAHPTTRLCLSALRKFLKSGDSVVDIGCGSGILSILSSKLGASFVLGLDIDQDATENANGNLSLNHIENSVEIRQGTVSAGLSDKPFDLAVANLNKREIFESFDLIRMAVKNKGILIFSGIQQEEEKEVEKLFKEKNLKIIEITKQEEWICFVCMGDSCGRTTTRLGGTSR